MSLKFALINTFLKIKILYSFDSSILSHCRVLSAFITLTQKNQFGEIISHFHNDK